MSSRFSAAKARLLCQNLCQAEINGSDRTGLAGPTEPSHLVCCLCGLRSDAFSRRKPLLGQNYSDSQESDKITFVAHCSDWRISEKKKKKIKKSDILFVGFECS